MGEKTSYQSFVDRQTLGKLGVFGIHLWLEHALARSLYAVLPNPDALLRDRGTGFSLLVSLCEAHRIVEAPLADAIRKVNALRNKCAHEASFQPSTPDWEALRTAVGKVEPSEEDRRAMEKADRDDPLEVVAALVEVRAKRVGATHIDAV